MNRINFGVVKPTFMIIGVQKGGTSSLFHYLSQHPKLITPRIKELHYFDTYNETPSKPFLSNFPRRYLEQKISFEATPRYLYFPETARKLYEFDSNLKFIVIFRDPVKRAFSAWNMYRQMSKDPNWVDRAKKHEDNNPHDKSYSFFYKRGFPTFEEWIKIEMDPEFSAHIIEPSIIRRGYYKEQIESYLKYFSKNQMYFVDFNNFKNNTISVLNDITEFLTISNFDKINLNLEVKNERKYSEPLDPVLYHDLLRHFQMKNEGLEETLGFELEWMH
tara:strand:+ start:178 stop:1002 length:825 start_codon:yes stop_codon:yes gene_type:complete